MLLELQRRLRRDGGRARASTSGPGWASSGCRRPTASTRSASSGYLAARTSRMEIAAGDPADLHAHPDADGDDGRRARLRLRRAVHPRARRVEPAGRRGVPRRAATTRRWPAPARSSRSAGRCGAASALEHEGRHYRIPLPAGRGHRPGQAAAADQPPGPRADPDRARRARAAQRRAGRGDRGGLAADPLRPGAGRRALGARARRGPARARPGARPAGRRGVGDAVHHRRRRRRPPRARRPPARSWRSTRAGWARAAATSTTTSSAATAGRHEAREIQDLYLDGKKDAAAAAVPREMLEAMSLIGPRGHVAERLAAFAEAGVTTLNVTPLGADPRRAGRARRRRQGARPCAVTSQADPPTAPVARR